jgi:hypothetical protein
MYEGELWLCLTQRKLSEIANQAAYRSREIVPLKLLPARLIEKIAITT